MELSFAGNTSKGWYKGRYRIGSMFDERIGWHTTYHIITSNDITDKGEEVENLYQYTGKREGDEYIYLCMTGINKGKEYKLPW